MQKYLLCPQCGIRSLFVLDKSGNRVVVYFNRSKDLIIKEGQDVQMEDLDLSTIFCLGCSWRGTPDGLKKHFTQ